MDAMNLSTHISSKFNEELELVRNEVLAMGGMVEQQVRDALTAAVESDNKLAQAVLSSDARINEIEMRIDEDCARIIAKRQPTAGDLRLMLVIMKAIGDLERIGDEAERIAKVALESFSNKQQKDLLGNVDNLGRLVLAMLRDTLDAFARMDVEAALKVHQEDQRVDREYEALMRLLMTYMMEDSRSIPKILNVMWAVRSLERIGDRCQNVCEYIMYLVKGTDVRHIEYEEMEEKMRGDEEE
ncbi:MAG: phosphate signaling complex protein PhoU [Natronospirillum sp.]|uniref:phosphate signaling complex protein PhoU n=1 Tax=Natronospirillum sp. TaxID=2812955 RepID=UPI0025F42903|nr:phosphate signaling complex protein PhoU [Natronospirillum sp.]MCH8551223.1 phosphate signaling complex protein PhoU [Natronospirillum sp.]